MDQLQMHLRGGAVVGAITVDTAADGADAQAVYTGKDGYRIVSACFDEQNNVVEPTGVCSACETDSEWQAFAIVKPAVNNTRVDMSPYGQSVFAGAIDVVQAIDLALDAMISKVDNGKMRTFLSDVMFDQEVDSRGRKVSIPFGKADCTVFRKVMTRRTRYRSSLRR